MNVAIGTLSPVLLAAIPVVLDGMNVLAPVWPATGVDAAGAAGTGLLASPPAGGVVRGRAGTRPTP